MHTYIKIQTLQLLNNNLTMWMSFVARRSRWLRLRRAPSLSWTRAVAVPTLGGMDRGEDGGSAAGRARSLCSACRLGQWMDASLLVRALVAASGSPSPTPSRQCGATNAGSYAARRCTNTSAPR